MTPVRVAELFAGVGGFRVGLERVSKDFATTFSSQWEPPGTLGKQFASRCYVERFGPDGHSNEDIAKVLDAVESGKRKLPTIDMVVGGFPCQDYSVAKPLNQAAGLVGKKGVLWWEIHRLLKILRDANRPAKYVLLENVDRLLKSPATQRGRDFAIMLASLSDLGYDVEWRVVNAADYGFPQKRRRVFIFARFQSPKFTGGAETVYRSGVLARSLPLDGGNALSLDDTPHFELTGELDEITKKFGRGVERTAFGPAGCVRGRKVWTFNAKPLPKIQAVTLADILEPDEDVDEEFFVSASALPKWKRAKGSKSEQRTHPSGFVYHYSEGALPFPDPLDRPARTILTSEGGATATRSKHIVSQTRGKYRRLTPRELERLNGFPDDWTGVGMSNAQRAFCMGNALVVGLVERIGREIARDAKLAIAAEKTRRLRLG